jgi:hypothetical protein
MSADRAQTWQRVAEQLDRLIILRRAPESITSDNGSEFTGKTIDNWVHQAGVKPSCLQLRTRLAQLGPLE